MCGEARHFGGMNWHELLQPSMVKPMLLSGGAALLLFSLTWWREREAQSALPLAVLGFGWVICHIMVFKLSYLVPPREAADWLVPGAEALLLTGLAMWLLRGTRISLLVCCSALLIAAAAWLALRQMPWLMDRGETAAQRLLWTGAGIGGVLAAFVAAERTALRVPPSAVLCGLAVFALLAGLGLWRMASPERIVARPLAVAAMTGGAALAALLRRRTAVLTPGMAGWISGGILILFFCGCLSRASAVPVWPMAAAAAGIPAAALLVAVHRRLFVSGAAPAWLAGVIFTGTVIFWLCSADQKRLESLPSAPPSTGADDTGAYD